jgi:hypothetical protein
MPDENAGISDCEKSVFSNWSLLDPLDFLRVECIVVTIFDSEFGSWNFLVSFAMA